MRLARQFDDLDKFSVGRNSTENEALFFENITILGVEFVTMSVTLAYLAGPVVDTASERIFL